LQLVFVPGILKLSQASAVFKSGDATEPSKYRPSHSRVTGTSAADDICHGHVISKCCVLCHEKHCAHVCDDCHFSM